MQCQQNHDLSKLSVRIPFVSLKRQLLSPAYYENEKDDGDPSDLSECKRISGDESGYTTEFKHITKSVSKITMVPWVLAKETGEASQKVNDRCRDSMARGCWNRGLECSALLMTDQLTQHLLAVLLSSDTSKCIVNYQVCVW